MTCRPILKNHLTWQCVGALQLCLPCFCSHEYLSTLIQAQLLPAMISSMRELRTYLLGKANPGDTLFMVILRNHCFQNLGICTSEVPMKFSETMALSMYGENHLSSQHIDDNGSFPCSPRALSSVSAFLSLTEQLVCSLML